jgi:hypothetical protein
MIFDPYEVLACCSDYTPMLAGDVISLGTFAGDKKIKAGDTVELEIEKIGVLHNRIAPAKAAWQLRRGRDQRPVAEGALSLPLRAFDGDPGFAWSKLQETPSPRLRGEGWGEGLLTRTDTAALRERAPAPKITTRPG